MIKALKSVVSYVIENGVLKAVQQHAAAVEEAVDGLKLRLNASDDPLSEMGQIQTEVDGILFEGQVELAGTAIRFNKLKDHLKKEVRCVREGEGECVRVGDRVWVSGCVVV